MIVCGFPGSAWASSWPTSSFGLAAKAFTTRCTSWNAATDVPPATAITIRNAPIRTCFQSPLPFGLSSSNAEVSCGLAGGYQMYELDQGVAVAVERGDRHPLLGPVVAGALGPELHGRRARVYETDGVGCAVAPNRDALGGGALRHRLGQHLHVRVAALHHDRRAAEDLGHVHVGDLAHGLEDLVGVLARQVAHVHVHRAQVGDLVDRVAAHDPAEADRRPVEELRRLARERQRLDLPEHVD